MQWIWEQADWPSFRWQDPELLPRLMNMKFKLGWLHGSCEVSGDSQQALDVLLANLLASAAIEDERLNAKSVRSSLAKRLGVSEGQPYPVSERSEGLADMLFDALGGDGMERPLTVARLCHWHRCLFEHETPLVGRKIEPGVLRGPDVMQVVSGRIDRPVVHFEAPGREGLEQQLATFVAWFNDSQKDLSIDPLVRAGIAHLWFVTLHPFEDGNGRITRMITDMALAQADRQSIRLYAMSVAILERREGYYNALQAAQRDGMDVTAWLAWFLDTLLAALDNAQNSVSRTLAKTRFWLRHPQQDLRPEQVKVLNRLLDGGEKGFEGGISASQYQAVTSTSKATATRHLSELVERGCLAQGEGKGRSARYVIYNPWGEVSVLD